ncbi:phage integrase SAM-like domain-containing protein [Chryseobacterium cucumeris]|uniref:phage integrase SAM-like domain-containing protein n=1 Tax=Chryseobacterium cucumeris TaxID=1813611 RepID=UPI0023F54C79|nr:phage integrase SAM-like domain-containing protein [Chryseobacterium cucumeris]
MIFKFHLIQTSSDISQIFLSIYFTKNTDANATIECKTPLFIPFHDWDCEKQRPKNIYKKKYKELNTLLNIIKVQISQYLEDNKLNKKNISKKQIISYINTIIYSSRENHGRQYPQGSLLSLMSLYISQKQQSVRISTYRRYLVFMRLIEKFEGYTAKQIYLKDIDSQLITSFYYFGKKEMYTESTINRTVHFLKTILNFAERNDFQTRVRNLEIPKTTLSRKITTLNENEILKIKQTQVPQELQIAKDWLLISCYTGQRISDFMRFTNEQLIDIHGKKCIAFIQRKTSKEIILPLHPTVIKVIERNNYAFPQSMDVNLYNKDIKKIAQLAGINTLVKVRKRIGYRSNEILIEKWETVSSHIGRRSFASNFYGKIPTPLLIQATGHSSERMFLNYINPINHERIITLGNYFDELHSE